MEEKEKLEPMESTAKEPEKNKKMEEHYEKLYHTIMDYEVQIHEKNQKLVKRGIVCLFVVPLIFLILLFVTDSSKPIFLVLWIISLYGIAVFLIGIEYGDYKLQEKLADFKDEDTEVNNLVGLEMKNIEEALQNIKQNVEKNLHSEKEVESHHE